MLYLPLLVEIKLPLLMYLAHLTALLLHPTDKEVDECLVEDLCYPSSSHLSLSFVPICPPPIIACLILCSVTAHLPWFPCLGLSLCGFKLLIAFFAPTGPRN